VGQRHRKKRGPKGTGAPDPTKDRRAHEAARGKKKMALSDLSSELPTDDDLANYTAYIAKESDRGAAVMAAALVEKALEEAIRSRLADPGDGIADSWFEGRNAPFRSFAAKIALGRALAIYGEEMEARLTRVKNVRNAFAHRMIPLDFTHPTLVEECRHVTHHPPSYEDYSGKIVFGAACMVLAKLLGDYATEKGNELVQVKFP
jgi:hypothetical protein